MILDRLERGCSYSAAPAWQRAFAFIAGATPGIPDGIQQLMPGLEARIMTFTTKQRADSLLEAHREFIDIQVVLEGIERIEWFPVTGLKSAVPYDATKDAAFFAVPAVAPASLTLEPGMFAAFFPQDAHLTQVKAGNKPATVKKIVMKVRVALVQP